MRAFLPAGGLAAEPAQPRPGRLERARVVGRLDERRPVRAEVPGIRALRCAAMDPLAPLQDLPGVDDAVGAARGAVDRLLSHRVLRRRSAEVTAESALRGARASAVLAGARITLPELRRQLESGGVGSDAPGAGGPVAGGPPGQSSLVGGAVRLYADLGTLLGPWEHAPRQVLARMHVLAVKGRLDDGLLGRPRDAGPAAGTDPDDRLDLGPLPAPAVLTSRLADLSRLLLAPTRTSAIVTAAVVHGELLALRPFPQASGLIARAAARLVLVSRGLDPKSVSVPEVGHLELEADYAGSARAYISGTAEGVARWLGHCARAVELGAQESVAVCEALRRGAEIRAGAEDG